MAYDPRQVPKGATVRDGSNIAVRIEVDRPLPDGSVVLIKRDGVTLGSADPFGLRIYQYIDTTAQPSPPVPGTPEFEVNYTAHVSNGSYSGPECASYSVVVPAVPVPPPVEDAILLETGDPNFILLESDTDGTSMIDLEPEVPPAPDVMMRDDFNGNSGTNVAGRTPSISDNGEPWTTDRVLNNQQQLLDGLGNSKINASPGSSTGNLLINLSATQAFRVETVLQCVDARKLYEDPATSIVLWTRLYDGNGDYVTFIIYQSTDVSCEIQSPNENIQVGTHVWGNGGDSVKFDFIWNSTGAYIRADDSIVLQNSEPVPPPSGGAGSMHVDLVAGNNMDYIEVARVWSDGV